MKAVWVPLLWATMISIYFFTPFFWMYGNYSSKKKENIRKPFDWIKSNSKYSLCSLVELENYVSHLMFILFFDWLPFMFFFSLEICSKQSSLEILFGCKSRMCLLLIFLKSFWIRTFNHFDDFWDIWFD